jgi:hypothetical protein
MSVIEFPDPDLPTRTVSEAKIEKPSRLVSMAGIADGLVANAQLIQQAHNL